MTQPRFLQIHTLSPYTAVLLNRDDNGLAKRLLYGNAIRTRISSQCLKRHWRMADDPQALQNLEGAPISLRSRDLVTERVIQPLQDRFPEEVVEGLEPEFQKAVYGDKGDTKGSRQTLLLGDPELQWLSQQAEELAERSASAQEATQAAKEWAKQYKKNIAALRENTQLPAGLTAALFGRMVTADPAANITAPVHVAHAFTVHEEEQENDYFTAVDDLGGEDETGADTVQETEISSGLFYVYVVVDLPGLLSNLSGDADLAGRVLHSLVHLIAEVSPGAKLGSTAPYSRASFMLLEAGDRQPRSLAEAYRRPCAPLLEPAVRALSDQLVAFDRVYSTGEKRRVMSLLPTELEGTVSGSLADLAQWAGGLTQEWADPS